MRRSGLKYAAVATSIAAVLAVAACGDSSDDDAPTSSPSPTTTDRPTLPDPITDLDTFLAQMDSGRGCSDALVDGVGKIVAFAGGQVTSSRPGKDPAGISTCTFDIDAGNAKLVPSIVVAGLPASKNTVTSPATTSSSVASGTVNVGNDRIGRSVQDVAEKNIAETGYDPRKDPISGSAGTGGQKINIILQTIAIAGVTSGTSGTQAVPGYYVVAEDPTNANTSMLTLNPRNYIDQWFQGDLQPSSFN